MRKKSFDKQLFIREELNGICVYDYKKDYIAFYKDLLFSDIEQIDNIEKARGFLQNNTEKLSCDLDFSAPLKVDWLVSDKCNLDCIYCFADNKLNISRQETEPDRIIDSIKAVNPIILGLTGGEPALLPNLYDILKKATEYWFVILDTNGTVKIDDKLCSLIKESNVLVRISLDSVTPGITNELRPDKTLKENYLPLVFENIRKFVAGNLAIHTVVSKKNINNLHELGEKLLELGVRRWHLYGVSNSIKCKEIYNELKISENELYTEIEKLKKSFSRKIRITCFFDEKNLANQIILMVDKTGRFFVDSTECGITYVGDDICKPTHEEIKSTLNIKQHCMAYLSMAVNDAQTLDLQHESLKGDLSWD